MYSTGIYYVYIRTRNRVSLFPSDLHWLPVFVWTRCQCQKVRLQLDSCLKCPNSTLNLVHKLLCLFIFISSDSVENSFLSLPNCLSTYPYQFLHLSLLTHSIYLSLRTPCLPVCVSFLSLLPFPFYAFVILDLSIVGCSRIKIHFILSKKRQTWYTLSMNPIYYLNYTVLNGIVLFYPVWLM